MHSILSSVGLARPDLNKECSKFQREIRAQQRKLDADIRNIEREGAKTEKMVREAARRNDPKACKLLAVQLVRGKKTTERLRVGKAQLSSLSMQLKEQVAMHKTADKFISSTKVLNALNDLVKIPSITESVSTMSKNFVKLGLVNECIENSIEDAFSESDIEDEVIKEVDKITSGTETTIRKDKVSPKLEKMLNEIPSIADEDVSHDLDEITKRFHELKS